MTSLFVLLLYEKFARGAFTTWRLRPCKFYGMISLPFPIERGIELFAIFYWSKLMTGVFLFTVLSKYYSNFIKSRGWSPATQFEIKGILHLLLVLLHGINRLLTLQQSHRGINGMRLCWWIESIVLYSMELHYMILIDQVVFLDWKTSGAFLLWPLNGGTNQLIIVWTMELAKAQLFLHLGLCIIWIFKPPIRWDLLLIPMVLS